MTVLVSDMARVQIGVKVLDLLRTYMIDSRQSEMLVPCAKACMHSNESFYTRELNWRTATEWLLGGTPDITVFLIFIFYEPIYYMELEPP